MAIKLSQKEISLDLQHQGFTNTIYVQGGDVDSRELIISLFDDGEEYNISSSSKVYLSGERSDKAVVSREVDSFTNNIIKVIFRNEEICAKGISKYKIIIKDSDNVLSSVYFKIKVYENVYDENGILATPQYSELQETIKKANSSMDDFHNKLDEHYFVLTEDKDIAGGVPSLDSNTKVPIAELYEATTTTKGITQLTDSVSSTSITTAATPNSVKSVKDSLNSEINRATSAENNLESKKIDKTTVATSSTLGLVKSGTDITVDTSGNVSVNDNSHKHTVSNISDLTATASELNVLDGITATTTELNYIDGVTSNIQTQLNSKSANGHTHDDRYYTESEIDTTVSNINDSISSHTGNTSNPHSVTKAQVGLGNVENKSSATIRGEITKSNVTTALGYTPYTPNEIDNKFSALETNIDWKESVSTFDDIATTYPNPVDGWTVNVKDTDYTYRYSGTSWVAISANAIPKATNSVDGLLSKEDHVNYEDANSKKHTHSNKSVIDGITSTKVSNWDEAKSHADSAHSYLPLSGGTMTGDLTISNGSKLNIGTSVKGEVHGSLKYDTKNLKLIISSQYIDISASDPVAFINGIKIGSGKQTYITNSSVNNNVYLSLPSRSGIIALASDYLPLSGGEMIGNIILPQNDSMGIIPKTNNYGQIGSSDKKFFRMYATNIYGANIYENNIALSSKYASYEEGTWTPSTITGTDADVTIHSANYILVGKIVYLHTRVIVNSSGRYVLSTSSGVPISASAVLSACSFDIDTSGDYLLATYIRDSHIYFDLSTGVKRIFIIYITA